MEPFVLTESELPWQVLLKKAITAYVKQTNSATYSLPPQHFDKTPDRVVKAFEEYVSGGLVVPSLLLSSRFPANGYDQMIHVKGIKVLSSCAHHLCPIVGKAHFAYIPGDYLIGLSKIPRLVKALARRLQVQEHLTETIVDVFYDAMAPIGCAVCVRAYHFCMMARGVEEPVSFTTTTALRGVFKTDSATREEFLLALDQNELVFP